MDVLSGVGPVAPSHDGWEASADAIEALRALISDPLVVLAADRDPEGSVRDFEVVWANPSACAFASERTEDLVGRRVGEMPTSSTEWTARYAAVLDTGEAQHFISARDAEDLAGHAVSGVFEVRVEKLGDGVAVTWRDISEVARAEQQSQFHALLLDEVDAAVIATDKQLDVTFWNKGAEGLYGWTSEQAVGRSAPELLVPLMSREEVAKRRQAILGGPVEWEMEVHRSDGSLRVASLRIGAIEGCQDASGFIGVAVDITARHQADADRRQDAEFLSVLTAGMGEGMFALDQDGRTTFVNPTAEALLGWGRDELLGVDLHALAHRQHPDGSPCPAGTCPITWARLHAQATRIERDEFVRHDGTWLPVSYTASPLMQDNRPRGCVVVFRGITEQDVEDRKAEEALEKLFWLGRVQDAIEDGRLVLYAQPIVDVATGVTLHHELLLRMLSPADEVIVPDRFIPAAEEFGLIGRIDWWVVEQAVGLANRGHAVAFNLSARSVCDPRMLEFMRDVLNGRPAPSAALICEITETALIEDAVAAESFVAGVVELGCKVALDDFGAGFAGFGYLKRLPVSMLKIDRQFVYDAVDDEGSRHVVAAVVALAQAFALSTVAEGVEDTATIALLRELGIDSVQGYVFGRPRPLAEELARRPGEEPSHDHTQRTAPGVAAAGRG